VAGYPDGQLVVGVAGVAARNAVEVDEEPVKFSV